MLNLTRKLNCHGARYVLVGYYALAAQDLVRITIDIAAIAEWLPRAVQGINKD